MRFDPESSHLAAKVLAGFGGEFRRASVFAATLVTLAVISVSVGCRTVVSEMQRAKNESAGETASLNGVQFTLHPKLHYGQVGEFGLYKVDRRALNGLFIVESSAPFPADVEVYHFALRPDKATYHVQNFFRDRDGRWTHAGARRGIQDDVVSVQVNRFERRLELLFNWNVAAPARNPPEAWDVSVSLTDSTSKRTILFKKAAPVTPAVGN